jgi:purine-binding chemotaxis protein CheW
VMERPATAVTGPGSIAPGIEQIQGVIQLEDGLALIYDLDRFLSLDETQALDEAMRQEVVHGH